MIHGDVAFGEEVLLWAWGSKIGDGPLTCGFRRRVRILWYEYAPLMLITLASAWIFLIGIAALVGPLYPDEKIRADAQKVLERLVGHGRRANR